jgi:hypothetical protein
MCHILEYNKIHLSTGALQDLEIQTAKQARAQASHTQANNANQAPNDLTGR